MKNLKNELSGGWAASFTIGHPIPAQKRIQEAWVQRQVMGIKL